ncbi:MAG TPA: BrxA/BrxB family bacilliredoxin [Calditrichia bacterium]|nr:BrxA/BrxB family bacilliredoxin [Calditrichia bacterium]HQV34474.1 BrxA/BrxB family bacilliredoxin [Calditrichia bacterium]
MSSMPFALQPNYDPEAVQPMRDELLGFGFAEATTPEALDDVLNLKDDKVTLVFINSVCGCAAGSARPGVGEALQHTVIPDRLISVFAGQDKAAVNHLRETFLAALPPSSPAMALIKNGEVVFMVHRYMIEGYSPEQLAMGLRQIFDETCTAEGPSVPKEHYDQVLHARVCGSTIPRYQG